MPNRVTLPLLEYMYWISRKVDPLNVVSTSGILMVSNKLVKMRMCVYKKVLKKINKISNLSKAVRYV